MDGAKMTVHNVFDLMSGMVLLRQGSTFCGSTLLEHQQLSKLQKNITFFTSIKIIKYVR